MLEIKGLNRHFGGLMAVSDLDLSIEPGEFFGLIGPNGAGKTTVFNLVSGLIDPSSGKIFLGEKDITGASPHTITRLGLA
jgi:branched-chain amino acid transport system ATP-binding protein